MRRNDTHRVDLRTRFAAGVLFPLHEAAKRVATPEQHPASRVGAARGMDPAEGERGGSPAPGIDAEAVDVAHAHGGDLVRDPLPLERREPGAEPPPRSR